MPGLFVEMGALLTFCLGWRWTAFSGALPPEFLGLQA
jgi:hypothetical protein